MTTSLDRPLLYLYERIAEERDNARLLRGRPRGLCREAWLWMRRDTADELRALREAVRILEATE